MTHVLDASHVNHIVERLAAAERVFALTGAGLGVASGLPTFRGAGGLWKNTSFVQLASRDGFESDPRLTWEWYNERIAAYSGATPNAGHDALAELEHVVPHFCLTTQNVDGLHLRAGSRNVIELHGDLRTVKCTGCDYRTVLDGPFDLQLLVHGCGGKLRPNVVWFGEQLPQGALEAAWRESSRADLILVAGTSAQVEPAASLARTDDRDVTVVEINPEPSLPSSPNTFRIEAGTEVGLPAIVAGLRAR